MNDLDAKVFVNLFRAAYKQCFGHPLSKSLSETESKQFSNQVWDQTGLTIGAKSIKNYSIYVADTGNDRVENPSIATLDTLARYVLSAPNTTEIKRKEKESHYPYWYDYKDKFLKESKKIEPAATRSRPANMLKWIGPLLGLILGGILALYMVNTKKQKGESFVDEFKSTRDDSLGLRGWTVKNVNNQYWNQKSDERGYLTLFTLKGDNWPDSANSSGIPNLLIRKLETGCFTAEMQVTGFVPMKNWQQTGILLLEDSNFSGKALRLSLAYNDYFGGYTQKPEILIQAITSLEKTDRKPEEIAHKVLFNLGDDSENIMVQKNLAYSGLRIEKNGRMVRLLYTAGPMENAAFKEVTSREFNFDPHYIGLFAIKGFVNDSVVVPVRIRSFNLNYFECKP